jgi:hypothetical protein
MVGEQPYSFDRGVLRWLGAAVGTARRRRKVVSDVQGDADLG